MRVDLVRELIDRLLEVSQREGTLTESLAIEIEMQFRQEYHGTTYVISNNRASLPKKQSAAIDAYLRGQPVDEITRAQGISRATLYRYLKK